MKTKTNKALVRNLLLSALLCVCFLALPFRVQAETFVNPSTNPAPAECLFNWAEHNYPNLFAPAGSTQSWTVYSYRNYPATSAYLGVNSVNNHVYYLGPEGVLQDAGPLADWAPKAGCQVPPPSPAECLFNWAELNYPGLFAPSRSPWVLSSIDWTSRYYSLTNAHLRIQSSDTHVYYQGPDGLSQDVGPLADWTPKASCRPPVANAGPDQTAFVGATVTLDGSASSDLDGNLITYQWTLTQKPSSSQTLLINPTALHPTLAIDKPGTYHISLVVNDGQFAGVPATVTINTQNSKPVANAGIAQSGKVGGTLALNGSASRDVDGDALTYRWTLPAKPQGSSAQLNNPNTISPRLTLDKPGSYTAQLIVNDGKADSTPAKIVLSTVNSRPVAKAGPAQSILLITPAPSVQLDGSGSSDADSDPLSFRWALISKPAGSQSVLLDPLAPSSRFTPDFIGDYVAQLIVNDGHVDSDPNTVQITATAPPPPQNHLPQISTNPVLTVTVGDSYSYDVDASDSDNDILTYSLSMFPTGMTINAQTGLINWTPGAGQIGPQSVTVNVTDGKGGSTSQSFEIVVVEASNPNQTTVPEVTGATLTAAQAAIQQAKLISGTETLQHSDTVPHGKVISQSPIANNKVSIGTAVNIVISLGPNNNLPPDPATVAPKLDNTVAVTTYAASEFLYKGSNPIQTLGNGQPLAQGTIEPKRLAVIRGKVLDKQNIPLPGVTISILNHPELGQTLSRSDGEYDLAVNGGGTLSVNLAKNGYLPSQRTLQNILWQDYKIVEDVVLIEQDTKVTSIDLTANTIQVAQGSPVTDKDGTRQATLIIPQGTTARVYNPDSTTREVSYLNLRLTEYTVGDNGPKAMPSPLPPASGYTYALELKAEEATVKQNGQEVLFNQPVPFYVDNFLNFPVGETAPLGYYDGQKAAWIPADSGRVIKIISINNGLADIDSDGDGAADSALGLTSAERGKLGVLYAAGKTLWRVSLTHLSSWDINWGFAPPPNAIPPNPNGRPRGNHPDLSDPSCSSGSIIECENQTLGETLPVVGTPYTLNYRSSWQPGRRHASLDIPLSGDTVPASLERIDLVIHLEGRIFKSSFLPIAQQTYHFDWDGQDAYGRQVQGIHSAFIEIGFVYRGVYASTSKFGYNGYGLITGDKKTRDNLTIWQKSYAELNLEGWVPHSDSLGGWTLSMHHVYDPKAKTLYLGSGRRRGQEASSSSISNIAGTGYSSILSFGDGGPATSAGFAAFGLAVSPDGSFYISDVTDNRIRRVGPDGIITSVAGNRQKKFSGDGGQATAASINGPHGLAIGPDGSLYIADTGNNRIRRVAPDGIITTVAGNGTAGFSGDGGPAIAASLSVPISIVPSPDGSLYIADSNNNRIRRVAPDGIITTFAGNGKAVFFSSNTGPASDASLGNGGTATEASITLPWAIALGPDGSLYFPDRYNQQVRRVTPDGLISRVVGTGGQNGVGDGNPAISAELTPNDVAFGSDGSLYIADSSDERVRRVGPDGIIATVAGGGNGSFIPSGIGGPATSSRIHPDWVLVGPDDSLYIVDSAGYVRRVAPSYLPGFSFGDISIASEDGSELYQFTAYGRHERTLNTLTGATLYAFGYDSAGHLISVTDANGDVTAIERDVNGDPTAIVAPFGQRTALTINPDNYLAKTINPAGEVHQMSYGNQGLLTGITDPNGNSSMISYDAFGRLTKDINATGGSQALTRLESSNGFQITRTTALGRSTNHQVLDLLTGDQQRTELFPDGTKTDTIYGGNGTQTIKLPDATIKTVTEGPDPRFFMQAPVTSKTTVVAGGLTSTMTINRAVTLTEPPNPLSLASLIDTVILNGRTSTSAYDAAAKTVTDTSAAGRKATTTIDSLGRIVQAQVTGILASNRSYDTHGRLTGISQGASPDDRTAAFSYNPEGYLDTVTDPVGRTAGFTYDAAGRVTRQTLPDGREIAYSYDTNGNLTSLTPPGRPGHLFHYTATNQTAEYEPPQVIGTGNTLYSYNLDKDLTKITRPDGQTLDFAYDNAGRLSTLTLPNGELSYAYSATTGKLTGITAPDGGSLASTYNGALLAKTAWTGSIAGSVERSYDNDFRVSSLSVNGANPLPFQYDADGLLTKAGNLSLTRSAENGLLTGTVLGSLTESYAYDGFAEVTAYEAKYGAASLFRFEYDHDKLGRIIQKRQIKGGVTHSFDYGYDTAGRLIEVKRDGVVTAGYGYDSNGNRTHLNGVLVAQYDDQDRLLDYQGTTYQYTANGELQQKTDAGQTTQFGYDVQGNLRKVTFQGGTVIDYVIDGQNRRIGKKVNGTLVQAFLYQDQLKPIAELDNNGSIKSRFVYATGVNVPDYMIKGGTTYRIIKDHLGSPRLVVDIATNTAIQEMDYDAFGRVTLDTNPGFQPFGFAGGLYDRDTKLVRFGERDYDAVTGRWAAKDPVLFDGGDTNLFGYVLNDPVNLVDFNGLDGVRPGGTLHVNVHDINLLPGPDVSLTPVGRLQAGDSVIFSRNVTGRNGVTYTEIVVGEQTENQSRSRTVYTLPQNLTTNGPRCGGGVSGQSTGQPISPQAYPSSGIGIRG